jgi:hypothetical protein
MTDPLLAVLFGWCGLALLVGTALSWWADR